MNNVFYFNINYKCNQYCRFCFSHNTNALNQKKDISLENFQNAIDKGQIGENDRIIINGGEPTLHPELLQILEKARKTKAELVMYSNGQKFSDLTFSRRILSSGLCRITIPVHGNESLHNYITQKKDSFEKVCQAIKNITTLKQGVLELKFIITEKMAESNFNIVAFIETHCGFKALSSIVITGQVNTKVAERNGFHCEGNESYYRYVSEQVNNLKPRCRLKIYDLKLCKLANDFCANINSLKLVSSQNFNEFYFSDYFNSLKMSDYKQERKETSCQSCVNKLFCKSILDSYLILSINKDTYQLVME